MTSFLRTVAVAFSFFLLCSVNAQETSSQNDVAVEEEQTAANETGPVLTGDPQKDYIHDPNLPIELHGYDLSNYPFYKRVPKEGHNFTCDGKHDGFYASVPHQCQVYYNCLFGQRYDFLCANYTVFDQVNFICHYASEVDCKSSARFFDRNEELYVTTSTTTQAPKIIYRDRPSKPRPPPLRINRPKFRKRLQAKKRTTTPAPAEDYYDYYDLSYYDDYYDYPEEPVATTTTTTTTTSAPRPQRRRRPQGGGGRRGGAGGGRRGQRPGVGGGRRRGGGGGRRRQRTTTTTPAPDFDYYYDDYYYYDDEEPAAPAPAPQPKPTPAPAAPQSNARRSKPGQSRRPNFRRSDNRPLPVEEQPVVEEPDYPVEASAPRERSEDVGPAARESPQPTVVEEVGEQPVRNQGQAPPGRRRRPSFRRPNAGDQQDERDVVVPERRRGASLVSGRRV